MASSLEVQTLKISSSRWTILRKFNLDKFCQLVRLLFFALSNVQIAPELNVNHFNSFAFPIFNWKFSSRKSPDVRRKLFKNLLECLCPWTPRFAVKTFDSKDKSLRHLNLLIGSAVQDQNFLIQKQYKARNWWSFTFRSSGTFWTLCVSFRFSAYIDSKSGI